jgi:hypothetical protein
VAGIALAAPAGLDTTIRAALDQYPAAAGWLAQHDGWISILPRLDHP